MPRFSPIAIVVAIAMLGCAQRPVPTTRTASPTMTIGPGATRLVASLYPDQPTLDENERRVLGAEAKLEPYVDRITLTLPMLRGLWQVRCTVTLVVV